MNLTLTYQKKNKCTSNQKKIISQVLILKREDKKQQKMLCHNSRYFNDLNENTYPTQLTKIQRFYTHKHAYKKLSKLLLPPPKTLKVKKFPPYIME